MKIGKLLVAKIVVIAALWTLAGRAQAACGDPSESLIDTLTGAGVVLGTELFERTNNPSADAKTQREAAAIGRALTTLGKPATNAAQLYSLFFKAAQQLGALALQDPEISTAGSNVFGAFMLQAQGDIVCTSNRIAALNPFVRTKRAASNQLNQAVRTLIAISVQPNPQIGLLLGRQVFHKLTVANKLAAIGEAKPGFALDSVLGKTLEHNDRGGTTGSVQFTSEVDALNIESNGDTNAVNYVYARNGLHTALLVLTSPGDMGGTNTTNVKLRYLSNTNGTFTFKNVDADGGTEKGSGTFTID